MKIVNCPMCGTHCKRVYDIASEDDEVVTHHYEPIKGGAMEKIRILDKKKGTHVVVGMFDGITFVKKVLKRHFMKMIEGWGVESSVIHDLLDRGLKTIIIDDGKDLWQSDADLWLGEHAMVRDFGHGEQIFLGQKWMKKMGD